MKQNAVRGSPEATTKKKGAAQAVQKAEASGSGVALIGFGFRVQGLGFRVSGLGFRVSGLGFRV